MAQSEQISQHNLRVCYFGTYRANYSRNQIMIEGLRRNGVEVIECHERLWRGIEDRVEVASGRWMHPAFVLRIIRAYWCLLRAHHKIKDYDVMVLGYPGQIDVFLARVFSWLRGKPLVLDVFMSLYLIALERNLTTQHRVTGRLIYWLEKLACRLPDLLILDTAEYVQWFHHTFGLDTARFQLVPTGADDRTFYPLQADRCDRNHFRVIYYGTFIPNHGVMYIVEAARLLADEENIRFELVGQGPERDKTMALAKRYDLTNVVFIDWLEKSELLKRVAQADVCLGAFGTTPQSLMTVQNKIYEGLAMAKPVITGDALTVRSALGHGEHVYLVERANPQAIAAGILALRDDPSLRRQLAGQGYRVFMQKFTTKRLGELLSSHLSRLVTSR